MSLLLLNGTRGGTTQPPDDGGGGGGGGTGGGGPSGGGGPGSGGGSSAGIGLETIVWIDPRGNATPLLEANGIIVHDGPLGRMLPPFELTAEAAAGLDGGVLRHVAIPPRDVSIPVTLVGADIFALRRVQRAWSARLNPRAGDSRLRFVFADGSQRELTRCRYAGGFLGDEGRANASRWHSRHVLVVRAFDPFAYDTDDVVVTVAGGNQVEFFPLLPLNLSSGAIGTASDVVNDGDAPAYPVWTIQGPATGLTLESNDTGEQIVMPSLVLTGSQYLTIDTRPRHKTLLRDDGTNLYRFADWSVSSLFPLGQGANSVTATIGGSDASTLVTVRFRRGYLTAA